jgi:isochorismate synthase/2-succinyl-5-enolpyruvyl-6-hydroxy-3-cyclohexene-1-carboxylate synthase/2-succinyl-6-hydroxy-2,4-cyclohexadiene-1-carboxylate synthase/O-succinylbenzoate synthase
MTPQQLLAAVAAAQQQHQQQRGSWQAAAASNGADRQQHPLLVSPYATLLQQLDATAAAQLDASLSVMAQMSEMAVARALAGECPAGCGLFLGNSMPIRDMDMYAGPRQQQQQTQQGQPGGGCSASLAAAHVPVVTLTAGDAVQASQSLNGSGSSFDAGWGSAPEHGASDSSSGAAGGYTIGSLPPGGLLTWRGGSAASSGSSSAATAAAAAAAGSGGGSGSSVPAALVGVPIAANRGASGIDGVLSSAAGFAAGLARPVTLVIGDLSFLHDVNGLSLLRGGEMAPPLTVVLINNRGGGIFSFLPVAGAVGRAAFERLWGTPQNVDLEGGLIGVCGLVRVGASAPPGCSHSCLR